MPDRSHGIEPPRGLTNTPRQRSYDGRFGRMFGGLPPQTVDEVAGDADLVQLPAAMAESDGPGGDNSRIPAGYVYLGQFVDHDITFDPTSQLGRRNDVDGLINFRTPRFDLDSVYGSGPTTSPSSTTQRCMAASGFLIEQTFDLPRNGVGRALIGDPRNDENGIVSQLQVAFLKLHNRLLEQEVAAGQPPRAALEVGLDPIPRPYDLRHSFVSLLLAEGRSVHHVAGQAGHSPQMTLTRYGHVIAEHDGRERIDAEAEIRRAREGCAQIVRRTGTDG